MRGRVPRVEVGLSQDSAASATFVALRFTYRSQADRPSEIKSETASYSYLSSPIRVKQSRRTYMRLLMNAPEGR